MKRRRVKYGFLLLAVILLGLGSRAYTPPLPSFVRAYVGDALWSLAAYLTFALLLPRLPIRWVAVTAGLFSLTVELSQLYHAAWIDRLRQVRVAAMLLGHGFLWSDLVCYGVGIGVGILTESLSVRHSSANRRPRAP